MMGSWMPGITAWEWNATLNSPNTPNGDHTQQLPSETPHGAAASPPAAGSVARDSHNAAGAAEDGEQDAASGFAAHGLGTKVWRLRRRTIPIKPMTADERELYEQGKLGVEQFVIEEEEEGEEEEEEEEEAIPAPPSADLIHQAFANTMGGNEEATPAQRSSPPQNRISPSKISALFAEMGAEDAVKLQESAPSHISAPPSDAEKLDMMRIFAEAEGVGAGWGAGGYGAVESARVRGQNSEPGGEVDVSKLSDDELFRQLQLAQEQLLRGGVSSGMPGSGARGGMAAGRGGDQPATADWNGEGAGWQGDPALQAELQAAEEELLRQERELQEVRARALEEEELMRREELRIKAMAEQESKRKLLLAEKEAASRRAGRSSEKSSIQRLYIVNILGR
jgi:hypothetical protein